MVWEVDNGRDWACAKAREMWEMPVSSCHFILNLKLSKNKILKSL
jgi:hypothetical protein